MSQPWPWDKVTERSSSTFFQTHIFFVPNIYGLAQTVLMWEAKVVAAAAAADWVDTGATAETNWKHKVTRDWGDLMSSHVWWVAEMGLNIKPWYAQSRAHSLCFCSPNYIAIFRDPFLIHFSSMHIWPGLHCPAILRYVWHPNRRSILLISQRFNLDEICRMEKTEVIYMQSHRFLVDKSMYCVENKEKWSGSQRPIRRNEDTNHNFSPRFRIVKNILSMEVHHSDKIGTWMV